jgi:hypothetical protein
MLFQILAIVIYLVVGLICFVMASKTLSAKKFLPFHEEAASMPWDRIDKPLQDVITALIRISGLGFLITGLLLTIFPIVNYFAEDLFIRYAVPGLAIIFCSGLLLFNYDLFRKTKANTPWKASIGALVLLLAGIVLSSF